MEGIKLLFYGDGIEEALPALSPGCLQGFF